MRKQSISSYDDKNNNEIQFGCDCGDWMCSSPMQHYTVAEQDRLFVEYQMARFEMLFRTSRE